MAVTIKVNGMEIVCETAAEATALLAQFTPQPAPKPAQPIVRPPQTPNHQSVLPKVQQPEFPGMPHHTRNRDFDLDRAAVVFLETIRQAGRNGANGDQLTKALALRHPKGLGGRIAMFNNRFRELGLHPDNVYTTRRDAGTNDKRTWYASRSLDEAVRKLS